MAGHRVLLETKGVEVPRCADPSTDPVPIQWEDRKSATLSTWDHPRPLDGSAGVGQHSPVPFWRRKPYDRAATLSAAHAARARGRIRKAVSGYARVLEHDPNDWAVHAHLAPLLARRGKWKESRASFNRAAEGFLGQGFSDKAVAVWTLAAESFPDDVEYRERIANELARRGRRADAVSSLLDFSIRSHSHREPAGHPGVSSGADAVLRFRTLAGREGRERVNTPRACDAGVC